MATEDGSVKIKVNMDITDVGAGVKDIGAQLKKAGDAAARAGKAMGKSMSKGWGYNKDALYVMENFSKVLQGDAKAAANIMKYIDQQGVEAENAAKSVRELAEEEEKAAAAAKRTASAGATRSEGAADTIHKQLLSAQKALAELSERGLGPGDAKWDEAYQAAAQLHAEEKAYLADLAKTPEQREREAAAIAKAATRAEELRRKEEDRAAAARRQEAAEATEAQRLDDIAQSAQVSSQAVIRLTQELEQLQARQQELNDAGVGMGYAEYDANAERIRAVTAALREYSETGSDAAAQTLTQESAQTTAWERFRQKILSAAASLGLVRKQTNDTSGAMKRLRTNAGMAASGVGSVFKKVLRWGLGIGSVTMLVRRLWSAVRDGLTIMAQHDTETANTLNGLKTALTNVKLSLATAFGPVVTAVAPLLIKLSDLVTRAANAVARFFAILSGKSTYKKAVAAQDAITDSVAGTGAAAKEAAKNLSGLDELNTWQENKAGSGGGSGGSGSGSGVDMEEVETGAATDFEVRLRDILFNWDDLNPELIAEKILTGLCAAAGGIIGWTIGGPLGGLVGLTLGALLGVNLSQVTFDGDGTINPEEAAKLIVTAVLGLIGGVLGAEAGRRLGAAIGFTVGAGVSVLINKALFNNDGKLDSGEVKGLILTAAGALLGGALGFSIIGKAGKGAAGTDVGFSAKAGISMAIAGLVLETTGAYDMTYDGPNLENILRTAIGSALGVAGSLMVFGPGPAGWIVGVGLALTAAITGSIKAEMDKTQERFEQTPLYKKTQEWISAASKSEEVNKDIKLKLSTSIQTYETAGSDLKSVMDMLDRLFELDAIEDKTNDQLTEMQSYVDIINGLNIDQLHIDIDPDGKIVQTKEELQAITTELIKQAKIQAAKEGLIEAYKQQAIAEENLRDQQGLLGEAGAELEAAQERLAEAQEKLDAATMPDLTSALNAALYGTMPDMPRQVAEDFDDAKAACENAQAAYDALVESVTNAQSTYDEAGANIEIFTQKLSGIEETSGTAKEGLEDLEETEVTISVDFVVEKIDASSLPPEQKEVAVTAITEKLDSSPLTDRQKSIIMEAIVKTLDSTELSEDDKSLVMTALIHAVDGTGLTPDDKQILTTAKLDSVIDALKPEDKEIGADVRVNKVRAPQDRLTFDASARVTDAEDKIPPERKIISGGFKGTSFTNGLKSNPVINTVSKFVSSVLGLKDDQRTISTWAKYTASILGLNTNQRTISTWAQFVSSIWSLTKEQRTNTAWAQFTASIWSLTKDQRTNAVWAKFASSIWSLSDKQRTADVIAKATTFKDAIKSPEITVKAKISEIVSSAASKVKSWLGLATGGIYKNGRWEPIAGYAAGGSPRSARLFYANENGMPELIGRIGSSTAVMNNGQIVASVAAGVYRAVAAAFGRLGGWFSAMTARLGDIPPAIEMLAAMPRQIPQPVMATGTVLPPKAVYADGPVQGLADAVSGLRDALDRRSPDRSGTGREPTYNVNLNVDGQTLCRIVLREGRLRQLQSGGNPFMDLMGG